MSDYLSVICDAPNGLISTSKYLYSVPFLYSISRYRFKGVLAERLDQLYPCHVVNDPIEHPRYHGAK